MRSGHTEAAVYFCVLAELPEVGVICELANDDGTVMEGPQIDAFALEHGLARVSAADLIAWRRERENLVERVGEFILANPAGDIRVIAYATPFDNVRHFAFVHGNIDAAEVVPARLHRSDIRAALSHIREAGAGVVVYLRDGAAGVPLKQDNRAEQARKSH
jgi:3,4-dihydroxy 2-butanone 4-phosphate synthase/GTP cyclohydrolase II